MRDAIAGVVALALLVIAASLATTLTFYKRRRQRLRDTEHERGRTLIAEIPAEDDLVLFSEDEKRFYYGDRSIDKDQVTAVRVLINGASIAAFMSKRAASHPQADGVRRSSGRDRPRSLGCGDRNRHGSDARALRRHSRAGVPGTGAGGLRSGQARPRERERERWTGVDSSASDPVMLIGLDAKPPIHHSVSGTPRAFVDDASHDEEEVGQTVDIAQDRRIHRRVQRDDPAFGAAAHGAGDVQRRAGGDPPARMKRRSGSSSCSSRSMTLFEPNDVSLGDGRFGDTRGDPVGGIRELGPDREQVALDSGDLVVEITIAERRAGEAEPGVQLVDLAVGIDTPIVLP